jgi:hypothetical protein
MASSGTDNVPLDVFEFHTDLDLQLPLVRDFLICNDDFDPCAEVDSGLAALEIGDKKQQQQQQQQQQKKSAVDNDNDDDDPTKLEPIAISISITTQHVKDLHELLQSPRYSAYRLSCLFDFESAETANGLPGFTVLARLECKMTGVIVKELASESCFPSKKHAKEFAAGLMLDYLREMPAEFSQLPKGESSMSSARSDDPQESVNWVGKLQGANG